MTRILQRLNFAAIIAGIVACSLESAVAQSNDKTEPWETEWKVDRMTDGKTFFLSTDVQTEAGYYYQLVLRCEPNYIAMVLTAFTKNKEARRITPDFRGSRGIQIRFDKNRAIEARFGLSEYYNRLEGYLHWGYIEHHPQQLIASKSMLIANVFPDEIFEVKTGFDQATVDACNQSSGRKTRSEDTGGRRHAERAPTTSATESCLKADDSTSVEVEGFLGTSPTITLPNGRKYAGYIVMLPKPICATDVFLGGDSLGRVRDIKEVQLTFDSGLKISHLMGKRVVVTGTAFGQHTAYHIAPLILSVKAITEQRQ